MKWTVLIYTVEDDLDNVSTFFMDLWAISSECIKDVTFVIRYTSLKNQYGHYDIIVKAGKVEMVPLKLMSAKQMCDPENFEVWVKNVVREHPAQHLALVFSMHSSGWDVGCHEKIPYLGTYAIRSALQNLKVVPKIIIFDGCYMSTLENAAEMHAVGIPYMLACQTTSPNLGYTGSKEFATLFNGDDIMSIANQIAKHYIKHNNKASPELAYPTDVSVIDLSEIPVILDIIKASEYKPIKLNKKYMTIPDDPTFPFYDLISIADICFGNYRLIRAIRGAIIYHDRTISMRKVNASDMADPKYMNGISICMDSNSYPIRGISHKKLILHSIIQL